MFPPFNQKIANLYCKAAIDALEKGQLVLEQLTAVSEEREGQGLMVGCLVGQKADENEGEPKCVVLLAVSGISRQVKIVSDDILRNVSYDKQLFHPQSADNHNSEIIIVPPIVSNEKINLALEKNDREIHELTEKINGIEKTASSQQSLQLESLLHQRKELCNARETLTTESLLNVFSLYNFTRFDGKQISLNSIISEHNNKLPPTGTGDCCAPKLLSYAFEQGIKVLSMDEVYYGRNTPNKINGIAYPPCDERCGYILPSILGLEILYQDEQLVVVNKPSGLLSVPGRGEDKKDSVATRIRMLYPNCIEQPSVHRLDMETSGLMVLGLTKEAHKHLNAQFEARTIQKKYVALLDGVLYKATGDAAPKNGEKSGTVAIKCRLDVDNRPHQIYDEVYGKLGITEWSIENIENYKNPVTGKIKAVTRINFIPHTGRTHQLRLASSNPHGFNLPIVGDTLYGTCEPGERLMLHACELSFVHPSTGEKMSFYSESTF